MDITTLQYWHKLEHFYPYVIGEQTSPNIKTFMIGSCGDFNELLDAKVPSGKVVRYYAVYLGLFQVEKALETLEQGIGRKMRFRDTGDDSSCFCTFTMSVDWEFKPDSFKISSFPWAIHRVREGKIIIDQWDDDFHAFETCAFLRLRNHKEAFDYDFLIGLRDWFTNYINWNIEYCNYWMRIDRIIGDALDGDIVADEAESEDNATTEIMESAQLENSQTEDIDTDEQIKQNDLLNSFYVRDLERIIESLNKDKNDAGECFQYYLKHQTEKKVDIEKDRDTLFALLSPHLLPKGRWPSNYGLRLMQQVDVNAFLCNDAAYYQPLFSVNGPPGTGKTTLLKDIIAAIVVERAIQMCTLDMPDHAFGDVVCEIETKTPRGTYTNSVRDIKPELKRYGILVASNNNGAVENVTHTLPSLHEVSADYLRDNAHYFSEVSDLLFGEAKTWALNAAALGNKRNRKRFVDAFWPISQEHKGYNFNRELRETVKTPSLLDWERAKQSFQDSLIVVQREYEQAEKAYSSLKSLLTVKKKLGKLEGIIQEGKDKLAVLNTMLSKQEDAIEALEQQCTRLRTKLNDMEKSDSFFRLKKLFSFNTPYMKNYRFQQNELQMQILNLHQARDAFYDTQQKFRDTQDTLKEHQQLSLKFNSEMLQAQKQLDTFQKQTDSRLRIDAYFEETAGNEESLRSPWGYEALNQCRAKLFIEAMALHKAFVQNSRYLRENLDAFSKMMRGMIPIRQLPIAAPIILQSFMLMVPVVSTTFASIGIFLRYIPQQEIAYLFIDEAGQAMPQSAAGAIWRARKTIAVGDPLQIEPVVTLHDSIIHTLAEYYRQSDLIATKYTSVQSLADMANKFGGFRTVTEENDLWIGAPLIVHNRCQRRVFNIANKIAYSEKMVYATPNRPQAKCEWLQVSGNSQNGHYVPNQTEAIRELIVEAFSVFANKHDESQKYPAVFVISPFRSVRSGMATYFRKNLSSILEQHSINVPQNIIRKWINECIGTVHTFQGKETDTVILCLGVDSTGKNMGAVEWACERPNILNVAVTRSKNNLYIVGDKAIWAGKPFFKTAYEICEKI